MWDASGRRADYNLDFGEKPIYIGFSTEQNEAPASGKR
jgi:hypothetical protein